MARLVVTRVVINKATLEAARLGVADGLLDMAEAIITAAHPPDEPPFGQGLTKRRGTSASVDGRRVGGDSEMPASAPEASVVVVGGFDRPGRFNELGTARQPARPFLTPAFLARQNEAEAFVRPAVQKRIGR